MQVWAQLLPDDALRLVQDNLHEPVTGQRGGLLSFAILAALWTSSSALTAIIDGLNRAYDVEEGHPFWPLRPVRRRDQRGDRTRRSGGEGPWGIAAAEPIAGH